MLRIQLIVEYDGTKYYGWQFQKGQITIQEAIERALFTIFKIQIRITGAGRTDTGVHARNQVVHLDIPDFDLSKLKHSLNGILENDIRIKKIQPCPPDFHARFDATARRYCFYFSESPTAINRTYVWQILFPINIALMMEGAFKISQTRNFKSFCKVKSTVKHHDCIILKSNWYFENELLVYEIEANRFLHGMVRAIVGTLVELGRGMIDLKSFDQIIKSQDRTLVPCTAPAHGLFLESVTY